MGQEFYKDDNGREISAALVEFISPYQHLVDGFYRWECGGCKNEDGSRSCGWPIAGQVLRCSNCQALNLLVKTNTVELDKLVGRNNELETGLQQLKTDRERFDPEVKWKVKETLTRLKEPIQNFLEDLNDAGE